MSGKAKRRLWHLSNKPFVFEYFNGTCQSCNRKVHPTEKWDIHHLHYNYKGKLYDTPALELIENKVITLLCRPCHDIVHTASDPDNPQYLENKYPCDKCGKVERGIFDRKKKQNIDRLLCKDCFKRTQRSNQDLLEVCADCGGKGYGMTGRKQSEQLDKLLCRMCFKQNRMNYLARFEKCEVCGKLEAGLTKIKEKALNERFLCFKCFENNQQGVMQLSIF